MREKSLVGDRAARKSRRPHPECKIGRTHFSRSKVYATHDSRLPGNHAEFSGNRFIRLAQVGCAHLVEKATFLRVERERGDNLGCARLLTHHQAMREVGFWRGLEVSAS